MAAGGGTIVLQVGQLSWKKPTGAEGIRYDIRQRGEVMAAGANV